MLGLWLSGVGRFKPVTRTVAPIVAVSLSLTILTTMQMVSESLSLLCTALQAVWTVEACDR